VALNQADLRAAVPDLGGTVSLDGLNARVEVYRDAHGVPHVRARSVHDAFFAQGYVHAQDRLWQMDYDRHRASGRSAEWGGPSWIDQDSFMRRLGLMASAEADYGAFDPETRAAFDAYAAGVNAFIAAAPRLPIEYGLVGESPEPWRPWDGCAVFKVRHVLMGTLGTKLWRARLLQELGPQALLALRKGAELPSPIITTPGGDSTSTTDAGASLAGADVIAGLSEWGSGSNSWALMGERTASGMPLLAGDSHRALDVPNVYYQNHVACPEFDVIGFSFAGLPGFPHFGHNADVAWCVTHAMADYQDLFVERFAPGDPTRYEFRGEWRTAIRRRETIAVRGAAAVSIDVTATHHGPIVVGDPNAGSALALRYSAIVAPNAGFMSLVPMLRARTVDELDAAMRPWVDPVNNFLMADRRGTVGYLMRGSVPVRDRANGWLPVPGWTGEHEWQGTIPFDELPRARNPQSGYLATANNRIVADDYPYDISIDFAPPDRAIRIASHLQGLSDANVGDMAAIHADRISLPSRAFTDRLDDLQPIDGPIADAWLHLKGWDGTMAPDGVAPTVYALWREYTTELLIERTSLGSLRSIRADQEPLPLRIVTLGQQLRAPVAALLAADDTSLLPAGTTWNDLLADSLARAVAWLTDQHGPDGSGWTWERVHRTAPEHPLAGAFPVLADLLNPPAVGAGGDGDTPQAAGYSGLGGVGFALTNTSVTRYVFDLGDWDNSGWVVPLGASGHPGSVHYADQVAVWRDVRLISMTYAWSRITAEAEVRQVLEPVGPKR